MPSGLLADRFGGPRVLLGGLALWSLATLALPLARGAWRAAAAPQRRDTGRALTPGSLPRAGSVAPLAVLTLARVLFGFGSAVALPAVSATVSRLVPAARRASNLATIYAAFNLGSIVGMTSTPPLVAAAGWPACFVLYGALGLAWAGVATALLPAHVRAPLPPPRRRRVPRRLRAFAAATAPRRGGLGLRPGGGTQLAALVFVHSIIGWGFFVHLTWIPQDLVTAHALTDLRAVGLVSALPWVVCAAVGVAAGRLADWLGEQRQWPAFRVRTAMNRVATLGPAAALALLPLAPGPVPAVLCLCAAMGAQSFNYAGYHAHVQDVAGAQAGTLLALSNTGGIVCGIVGNIATGFIVARTGSFTPIFVLSACLYLSSAAIWTLVVRSGPIFKDV